ncbi:MAG: hypothetical protein ACM3UU_11875 [Ignavibacteriales bacterium]
MKKLTSIIVILFLAAFININPASAEANNKGGLVVKNYWGIGCSECGQMKQFLNELKLKYIGVKIEEYEIYFNKENKRMLENTLKQMNKEFNGVPIVIIEGNVFTGYGDSVKAKIENIMKQRLKPSSVKLPVKQKGNPEEIKKRTHGIRIEEDVEGQESVESLGTNTHSYISEETNNIQQPNIDNSSVFKDSLINNIPFVGSVNPWKYPLPVATILIAFVDSLNPCAFFILFTMLGLLVHAQSRAKVLFAGGIFVVISGIAYFIFMAAWLNLFLVAGNIKIITILAGSAALIIAAINIKDFFKFKKGISLTISQGNIKNLFERMRKLTRITSWPGIALSASVLAIAANAYEVLCTAGFPMAYTRILSLNYLPSLEYYSYLVLYNIVYIVPLAVIVIIIAMTLERFKMEEIQGRILKLISGIMMLGLGAILLFAPQLMEDIMIMILLFGLSVASGLFMGYIEMHKEES